MLSLLARAARAPGLRAARSCSTVRIVFRDVDGEFDTDAKVGETLLDVAHDNNIEIEGACGGELACSTCHVVLPEEQFERLGEPCEEEEDMLDLAWGLTDTSRLGCQVCVDKDMEGMLVVVPEETNNMMP